MKIFPLNSTSDSADSSTGARKVVFQTPAQDTKILGLSLRFQFPFLNSLNLTTTQLSSPLAYTGNAKIAIDIEAGKFSNDEIHANVSVFSGIMMILNPSSKGSLGSTGITTIIANGYMPIGVMVPQEYKQITALFRYGSLTYESNSGSLLLEMA